MQIHRRRLPHWDAPGTPVFVTWRLSGSLPPERVFDREHLSSAGAFLAFDRLLDTATRGPMYLRQPEIAAVVIEELHRDECDLHAYVVMPNHVHVLWTPHISLTTLMRHVKGATSRRSNQLLARAGPFWQDDYFDRLSRNDEDFSRMRRYIEWNPVKAGLVPRPEEFRYSSAWRD